MAWGPGVSPDVVMVAVFGVPLDKVPEPIVVVVVLSMNITVPVAPGVTVAVNVTGLPNVGLVADACRLVVVPCP